MLQPFELKSFMVPPWKPQKPLDAQERGSTFNVWVLLQSQEWWWKCSEDHEGKVLANANKGTLIYRIVAALQISIALRISANTNNSSLPNNRSPWKILKKQSPFLLEKVIADHFYLLFQKKFSRHSFTALKIYESDLQKISKKT